MPAPSFRLAPILLVAGLALFLLPLAPSVAGAQADHRAEWQAELTDILNEIAVTEDRQAELERELADLDRDRAALNRELIDTNQRVQELERDLDETEGRMALLVDQEAVLRVALGERRDVLAEVLAVLQRMGRTPPPAMIVAPEDALTAVRSAILLGAVVPEIRTEAEALATDIERLIELRARQDEERALIIAAATAIADEQERLRLLIGERQQALDQTAETIAAEQQRLAALAAAARNLEELIDAVQAEPPPAAAVEPPVVAGIEPPAAPEVEPPALIDSPPLEVAGIEPGIAFVDALGRLPRPANGELLVGFGMPDGLGGIAEGQSIATRSGARVAAPADGRVEFAGNYRSYGDILIIDVGGGYLVVLAGLAQIDVQQGQFVLAGEPVGTMPSTQLAAAGDAALGTDRPVLYVEFRRNGAAIDPGVWWLDPY